MQSGEYGSIESSIIEKYRINCSQLWSQANIFQLNPISTFKSSDDSQTNGGAVSLNQN